MINAQLKGVESKFGNITIKLNFFKSVASKMPEWILDPNYIHNPRYDPEVIKRVNKMYVDQEACFWTAEEIDLTPDLTDWDSLNSDETHFIKTVLAFFAASDGIVLENLGANFLAQCKVPEIREFYAGQIAMENIHSETYSLLIDTYLRGDPAEKERLFRAIETIPAVKAKADWALKWIKSRHTFAEAVLAFCAVEGILFSGSFCAIFWLKKRGRMPGLTFSNELISRDEGLHTEFGTLLYNTLEERLSVERAHQLVREALEVERYFILEALPVGLIGMNAELMGQYLECVADRLLAGLGYPIIWGTQNPFSWMDLISMQGKTNFFEKRVGDYQLAGVTATAEDNAVGFTADF